MNWVFITQKTAFFIATAAKTSNLMKRKMLSDCSRSLLVYAPDHVTTFVTGIHGCMRRLAVMYKHCSSLCATEAKLNFVPFLMTAYTYIHGAILYPLADTFNENTN
jgi:hypothetical protein